MNCCIAVTHWPVALVPIVLVMLLSSSVLADNSLESGSRIELIGTIQIPGSAKDESGLTHSLSDNTSNDMLGGFSGIAYSGHDDVYLFLSDRGPLDGAVDWSCRIQRIRVTIDGRAVLPITTDLLETILLRDDRGVPFTGLAAAFEQSETRTLRLDPEAIRVGVNGNCFVADEYGPRLLEFLPTGKLVREIELPHRLKIDRPGTNYQDENPKNVKGRQTNRGMEGLAISADKRTLFGLMQSPLLQDSYRQTDSEKPSGLNCRLEEISISGKTEREMLYCLDGKSNKLNEILACGTDRFIVIERDGQLGVEAKFKKLMLISTGGASDISYIEKLPPFHAPTDIRAVKKRVLIDLLDPQWELVGESMPEKIEGLAFGPILDDGRQTLLIATDNDFETETPSFVYVFAIPQLMLK